MQGGIGCLTGAAVGGLIQGTTSAIKGNNFWDGSKFSAVKSNTVGYDKSNPVYDTNLHDGSTSNTGLKNDQNLEFDPQQLGKKYGKHRYDYPNLSSYKEYYQLANEIYKNPNAEIIHFPMNSLHYPGETHYIYNGNLLRLDPIGKFRSLYPIIKY